MFLTASLPQGFDLDEMSLLMEKFDGKKTTTWNIAGVSSRNGGKCQAMSVAGFVSHSIVLFENSLVACLILLL